MSATESRIPLIERPFHFLWSLLTWVTGVGVVVYAGVTNATLREAVASYPQWTIWVVVMILALFLGLLLFLQRRLALLRSQLGSATDAAKTAVGERDELASRVTQLESNPDPSDVRLFSDLMGLLPPGDVPMASIMSPYFEDNRFHREILDNLREFIYEWQIPTRTFHHGATESARQELANAVGEMLEVTSLAMQSEAPMRPDHYAIPYQLEDSDYDEFMRRVQEVTRVFSRLRAAYTNLLSEAKKAHLDRP